MKRLAAALACLALALPAIAATPGQAAPDFALPDTGGKTVKLSEQRGKWVVLEWVNPECPYVRKHYDSQNMQRLQKEFGARQVAWLTINSTVHTHPEHKSAAEMAAWMKAMGAASSATLIDRDSKVARAYDARTTPHMYIVDPKGVLAYVGAIDDKRSTNPADVKTAHNHVRAALGEALEGRRISQASTTPYGCSLKY